MPKPATIEEAPHHLKLLHDYGKTAVALALALLSLSVAFAEKFLKSPVDSVQATLLVALWVCLFLALISGLMIIAHLTGVAANYMKALRIAYPDALTVVANGTKIKVENPDEEIEVTDAAKQKEIKDAIQTSTRRTSEANGWATFSFFMFGIASLLIGGLGFYGSVYLGLRVDAPAVVEASVSFATQQYKVAVSDAALRTLTYDSIKKTYTVEINNAQVANEKYTITVDGATGSVINAAKTP
jgi:hypothetical protein